MKLISLFLLLFLEMQFISLVSVCSANIHPVRKLYEDHVQMPEEFFFTPYELCILALDDLDQERNYDDVKNFIAWYLHRINKRDMYFMSGTIYDGVLRGNKETVVHQYDSVDGYSGLFLFLLNEYDKKTQDHDMIIKYWATINDIAYTIPYLQQKDGLTIAFVEYDMQYLMDNCEAYGGLTAFIALGKRLHLDFDAVFYQETADGIREAILDELYDEKNDIFYIANDASVKTEGTHWDVFYPDAYAQIFPVYFSVLDKKEGHRLFDSFKEHYPEENWLGSPIEQRVYCELVKAKVERENQSS